MISYRLSNNNIPCEKLCQDIQQLIVRHKRESSESDIMLVVRIVPIASEDSSLIPKLEHKPSWQLSSPYYYKMSRVLSQVKHKVDGRDDSQWNYYYSKKAPTTTIDPWWYHKINCLYSRNPNIPNHPIQNHAESEWVNIILAYFTTMVTL